MTQETRIQQAIQREASRLGCRLFRNNIGIARYDRVHAVRYGLCPGSSDLIGWTASGQFLAVEVKSKRGRASKKQLAFIAAVTKAGGIAGVCKSIVDFRRLVGAD